MHPEPGLRARKRAETWRNIQRTALALFEERGFDAFYVPEHTHIPVKREAAHPGTGDATLPMGMDALLVHRAGPAPGTMRCLVRATSIAADQTRCDIALLDEDGQARTELLGVSLIRRPDMASAYGARPGDPDAVAAAAPARPS